MKNNELIAMAIVALLFILAIALSLGFAMALVYGACWCFGWTYSHRIAVGIWIIMILARSVVYSSGSSK